VTTDLTASSGSARVIARGREWFEYLKKGKSRSRADRAVLYNTQRDEPRAGNIARLWEAVEGPRVSKRIFCRFDITIVRSHAFPLCPFLFSLPVEADVGGCDYLATPRVVMAHHARCPELHALDKNTRASVRTTEMTEQRSSVTRMRAMTPMTSTMFQCPSAYRSSEGVSGKRTSLRV
jgi:hypothetical protein